MANGNHPKRVGNTADFPKGIQGALWDKECYSPKMWVQAFVACGKATVYLSWLHAVLIIKVLGPNQGSKRNHGYMPTTCYMCPSTLIQEEDRK